MMFPLKKYLVKKQTHPSEVEALIKEASGPVLKVVMGNGDLATLFFDGTRYCLIYHEKFLESGLAPFNPEQLDKNESPEIEKCYYSLTLWHVFSSRIPSSDRPDFEKVIKMFNLEGNENPLVILGKVGSMSISKPWKLEVVK